MSTAAVIPVAADARRDFSLLSFRELLAVDQGALSPEEYKLWLAAYVDTPVGFVEEVLGLPLYWWQDDVLAALENLLGEGGLPTRQQIRLAAPNGSGKSERVVAGAILYWLATHPKGKVVFTTRDSKQLANQVWPALKRHQGKFPHARPGAWDWVTSPHHRITTPTGGAALLFTTNDEGRAEGWHMDFNPLAQAFEGPLLIVIDEAKSVPDRIYSATDRCAFNVRLEVSSPGKKAGRFHEGVKKNGGDGAVVVRAGLVDCPHIPQSKIDGMIADAPPGFHDDGVMALAIGLHCLSSATLYREPGSVRQVHIRRARIVEAVVERAFEE